MAPLSNTEMTLFILKNIFILRDNFVVVFVVMIGYYEIILNSHPTPNSESQFFPGLQL